MLKWLLYTIVILDPYKDIRYGQIDVYDYSKSSKIIITTPEKEKRTKKKDTASRYFCFVCDPPRWVYL